MVKKSKEILRITLLVIVMALAFGFGVDIYWFGEPLFFNGAYLSTTESLIVIFAIYIVLHYCINRVLGSK